MSLAVHIVDRALELATERGWGNVKLSQVAEDLGVPLVEAHKHYRDMDAVADAWFTRALQEMLRPSAKLHPPHPHHWVPMIFSLSRLIQWLREVALLEAGGRRRQVEEVGLTLLFLATLRVWLADSSEDQEDTRRFLRRRLERADRWMARCGSSAQDRPQDS
jgi:AcrR family transcriptional regulator